MVAEFWFVLGGVPPKELRAYGPPDDIEYVLVEINPKKAKIGFLQVYTVHLLVTFWMLLAEAGDS